MIRHVLTAVVSEELILGSQAPAPSFRSGTRGAIYSKKSLLLAPAGYRTNPYAKDTTRTASPRYSQYKAPVDCASCGASARYHLSQFCTQASDRYRSGHTSS